jgi:hypothetical protein
MATSGTTTLSAAQGKFHYVQPATVTLAGAAGLAFPNNAGAEWLLDVSNVTFGVNAITVYCGSGAAGTTIGAITERIWRVYCTAANTAYIQ